MISDEEGLDFFPDLKPTNFHTDTQSLARLETRLKRLFTLSNDSVTQAQTFDCLVHSFQPVGSDEWRFKVFNTVLNALD